MSSTFVDPPQPFFADWGKQHTSPLEGMLKDVTLDDFVQATVELIQEGEYGAAAAAIAILAAGAVAAVVETICDVAIVILGCL
jgi:hypothetical protein